MRASSATAGRPAAFPSHGHDANNGRRQSTRAVRSTAIRPPNYYARSFSYRSNEQEAIGGQEGAHNEAPGFFPAITFFTDAISALPKEVMRHFTLLKETEAKAHQFNEAIHEIADAVERLPDPVKRIPQIQLQAFVGMSLNNSINGSATASIVDGSTPALRQNNFGEMAGHTSPTQPPLDEQGATRRDLFIQLQNRMGELLPVLDEKNMMLSAMNDTLARQLWRLDGVLPHVEQEVSEEARLGSNLHWALPHMKDMRKGAATVTNERSRREVQAANSLAAAAVAVHEGDIAATRSEARREALLAKRKNQNLDSDFDDRPGSKRANPGNKGRKPREAPSTVTEGTKAGANGTSQSHKRRKVEKSTAAVSQNHQLESAMSAALNGRLGAVAPGSGARELAGEANRKKMKATSTTITTTTVGRKRNGRNSPSIASSPTRGTFNITPTNVNRESSASGRASTTAPRARQNSTQSIKAAQREDSSARARGNTSINGTKGGVHGNIPAGTLSAERRQDSFQGVAVDNMDGAPSTSSSVVKVAESAAASALKREDTEPLEAPQEAPDSALPVVSAVPMATTRSRQGSRPTNKSGTPVASSETISTAGTASNNVTGSGTVGTSAPMMSRSRSTRGASNQGINASAAIGSAAGAYSPITNVLDASRNRDREKTSHKSRSSISNINLSAPISTSNNNDKITSPPPAVNSTAASAAASSITANTAPILSTSKTGTTSSGVYTAPSPPSRNATRSPTASTKETVPAPVPATAKASDKAGGNEDPDTTLDPDEREPSLELDVQAEAEEEVEAETRDEDEEDDEPPSSPASDEPRYCVCGQVSYGDMIACDNDDCPREWFHLACVGLAKPPGSKTKWYCDECKDAMKGGRYHHSHQSGRR